MAGVRINANFDSRGEARYRSLKSLASTRQAPESTAAMAWSLSRSAPNVKIIVTTASDRAASVQPCRRRRMCIKTRSGSRSIIARMWIHCTGSSRPLRGLLDTASLLLPFRLLAPRAR